MQYRISALSCGVALALTATSMNAIADDDHVVTLPTVDVVAVSPLSGASLPSRLLPYQVQTITAQGIDSQRGTLFTDYLDQHLSGVTLNAAQNNPLQPDLQFRGFTGSPLLGVAQGISVYVDGVRANEVFGDTVNWDLIPSQAIARTTLFTGANPVFGLNTLGGAVSVDTKDGFSAPGHTLFGEGGSFGRNTVGVESGGNDGTLGYYITADHMYDGGWRDASPSHAKHLFGTLSYRSDTTDVDLKLGNAITDLVGNGSTPIEALRKDRSAIFTAPDETQNRMNFVALHGAFRVNDDTTMSATLYSRRVTTRSLNGDTTDAEPCDGDASMLCDGDTPQIDQNGNTIASTYNAINNNGVRRQRATGGTMQIAFRQPLFGHDNQFVMGIDRSTGRVDYISDVEAAVLNDNRSTSTGSGIFIPDNALAVHAGTRTSAVYLTDTWQPSDTVAVTASARYNVTHSGTADLSGEHPDLDGNHRFSRVNPALGATWAVTPTMQLYGGYNEATRAPTPVELTCADENAPCRLPNQFLADPPLKQVVAHNWEWGLRSDPSNTAILSWQVGLFRTVNKDDILFQSTGGSTSNEGFFANVGDTRRQGVQLGIADNRASSRLHWFAQYTLLDATYRSSFSENSANHPDADDEGLIYVHPGDRIPGLPRHVFKTGLDIAVTRTLSLGVDAQVSSGQYLRGDESNQLPKTPGYTVVNLHGTWQVTPAFSLFAHIDNVLDRHYDTFGVLGEPGEVFADQSDPRFFGPAAPRGAWIGASLDF